MRQSLWLRVEGKNFARAMGGPSPAFRGNGHLADTEHPTGQKTTSSMSDRDQASVLPEILEPIRRHLGISNRVHDIFVAHVVLQGSSVMPIVGKLVACGVPEHVRMNWEWELCGAVGHAQTTRTSAGERNGYKRSE